MSVKRFLVLIAGSLIFIFFTTYTAYSQIFVRWYVNGQKASSGNGLSWEEAFKTLPEALSAVSYDYNEIWVAQGTYKPDEDAAHPEGTGDRTARFLLKDDTAIYGGFVGNETSLDQRDWNSHPTILSGDLNGDDGPDFANNIENSYNVLKCIDVESAILDGFTITGGNANKPTNRYDGAGIHIVRSSPRIENCIFQGNTSNNSGGGMTNSSSTPTLINCTFTGNTTIYAGGGVYNYKSSPTITNCTFTQNLAEYYGGGLHNDQIESIPQIVNCTFSQNQAQQGGGIYNRNQTAPIIRDCLFLQNQSTIGCGGGMYSCNSSKPMVFNCRFIGNQANDDGGGFYCNNGTCAKLMNCLFSGNSSKDKAGGFYSRNNDLSALINCTFHGNSADYRGALYVWGGSKPFLLNCIVWGNSAQKNGPQIGVEGSSSVVSICYCDLQGDRTGIWTSGGGLVNWGAGNIATDPDFKDPAGADNAVGTIDDNLRVLNSSPCLDAGNNSSVPEDTADLDQDGNTNEPTPLDLDDNKRFMESDVPDTGNGTPPIVDMGPYERGRSAAWEVLPPYNLLWPLWSPTLSPPDPVTGESEPLLTELTKDTVLPVQPAFVWDPAKGLYWVLLQNPVILGGGLLYLDESYSLKAWPPENMIDPVTGDPKPINVGAYLPGARSPDLRTLEKQVDMAIVAYYYNIFTHAGSFVDRPLVTFSEILGLPVSPTSIVPSMERYWTALPPYNVLWPFWSPALSPENPINTVPTPLLTELTKNTNLPIQPAVVWVLDRPLVLF